MSATKQSGFVAGTLVHTDNGLVPIDKLKVGDKVLSRDENNPDGELAYKKVLSTFKSAQKQTIIYVNYLNEKGSGYFFCTENHPFWVDEYIDVKQGTTKPLGWLPAIDLEGTELHVLRTFDDARTVVNTFEDSAKQITAMSCNPKWGTLENPSDSFGIVDFGSGKPELLGGGARFRPCTHQKFGCLIDTESVKMFPATDDIPEIQAFIEHDIEKSGYNGDYQDYVYNIKVENNHTYFVGHTGIWVKGQV